MNKRTLLNVFKYLLAFGLLGYVIYANWAPAGGKGLQYVWQRHVVEGQPVHGLFLLAAVVVYSASVLVTLVRWYVLVRAQDLPFRLADALRFGLIGVFFNTFLPGSVGGDIIKAAALAREQSRRTVAVATVVMDRVIALWGLFWFVAMLGGAFWLGGLLDGDGAAQSRLIVLSAAGVVGVSMVVWVLMGLLPEHRAERFAGRLSRLPRVGGMATEFWRAVWMYRCRQGSVFLAVALSWVGFTGFVLAFYCCVRTVWDPAPGNDIPTLTQHFLIVPVGLIIMSLPGSPGGAGIAELGFGYLYQWFVGPGAAANGVLGTLLQRLIMWVTSFAGYAVYLCLPASAPGAADLAEPEEEPEPEGIPADVPA